MVAVRREESVLNYPTITRVSYVLVLHNGANNTFGARLATKISIRVVVAGRALNKDIFIREQTLTAFGAIKVVDAASHCVVSRAYRVVEFLTRTRTKKSSCATICRKVGVAAQLVSQRRVRARERFRGRVNSPYRCCID